MKKKQVLYFIMALLKLKDLHSQLEYVDDFESPKIKLEQYSTTPHIAGMLSVCWIFLSGLTKT